MEKKFTIEELQAQYDALGAELEARKKAEAEEINAKLIAEQEARYKEVVQAYKNFEKLKTEYVDDYGYFTFESTSKKGDSHSWYWATHGLF